MAVNAASVRGLLKTVGVDYSDLFNGEAASIVLREPTYLQYLDLQHAQLEIADGELPVDETEAKEEASEASTDAMADAAPEAEPNEGGGAQDQASAKAEAQEGGPDNPDVAKKPRESKLTANARSAAVMRWFTENLSNLIVSHTFAIKTNVELSKLIIENNGMLRRAAEVYFPFLAASAETKS